MLIGLLAENIISPQQLSKFERNIHALSIHVFLDLLECIRWRIFNF